MVVSHDLVLRELGKLGSTLNHGIYGSSKSSLEEGTYPFMVTHHLKLLSALSSVKVVPRTNTYAFPQKYTHTKKIYI